MNDVIILLFYRCRAWENKKENQKYIIKNIFAFPDGDTMAMWLKMSISINIL